MNPKVDWFFNKPTKWQKEYSQLRKIVLDCHLTEELKWGCPCYTYEGNNIVLIHGFKNFCALLFLKGVLLKDPKKILVQQTENVQAARQIRFVDPAEIRKLEKTIKAYIFEAVTIEEMGQKPPMKKVADYKIPEEFQRRLNDNAALKEAFYALTPGRQKSYLFHFSQAKLAKTREARVNKYIPYILDGKGLDD